MSEHAPRSAPEAAPGDAGEDAAETRARCLPLALALAYLLPALFLLGDYGPTWDCAKGELPYGERLVSYLGTGDPGFLDLKAVEPAPDLREPHPNFDTSRFHWFKIYPFGALLSGASCKLFWTGLGWLPAMSAHNLVIPLLTAVLIFFLARFTLPRFGALATFGAIGFLVLSPRFFCHSFNNLKDMPECVLYTLAILAGFRALTPGHPRDTTRQTGRLGPWIAAGIATGLALAQKSNALFIPPQLALFLVLGWLLPSVRRATRLAIHPVGFLLGSLAFLAAYYASSPPFWTAPWSAPQERLHEMIRAGNTLAADPESPAPFWTKISLYSPLHVLWTTPPLVLLAALVGLFHRRLTPPLRLFLVVSVAVPIGRNLIPGMRNFDGVRHLLEFYPPLCVLAGLGLDEAARRLASLVPEGHPTRLVRAAIAGLCLAPGAAAVAATHPHGLAYYNALIGGLGGAREKGVLGATDYWAGSYWQGLDWIASEAEPGARVLVPMAEHVARAGAPVRLRPDLDFWVDEDPRETPIYVMYVTRKTFRTPFMSAVEKHLEPVHTIRVQGAPILWIFRLADDAASQAAWATRLAEGGGLEALVRLAQYLAQDPEANVHYQEIWARRRELDFDDLVEAMRPVFPEELQADVRPALERRLFRKLEREHADPSGP